MFEQRKASAPWTGATTTITHLSLQLSASLLMLLSFTHSILAQGISIPDPGLNAAVRAALRKPTGPLTQQDMLRLTSLNASEQNVKSIAGLESAHNLVSLDLSA